MPTRMGEAPGDDDPDLFALMALSYRKPELAQAAWSTLYARHGAWLEEHVARRYGRLVGGEAGVRDLAHDVWIRVYERADTYAPPAASARTVEAAESELWTKGWLRAVTRSVFLDHVRSASRCHVPERGTGSILYPKLSGLRQIEVEQADDPSVLRTRERLLTIFDLIAKLPERERDVFHVSFQWYGPDDRECRIPQEELRYLCKRWGIDEAYIRQIRRRVLKMVEAQLARRSLSLQMARTG